MTKEINLRNWEEKVKDFKKSGLTQKQWCYDNGINLRTFNKWYRIIETKSQNLIKSDLTEPQKWLPIKIEEDIAEKSLNVRVGNAVIEIKEGFNHKLLSELINLLEAKC